MPPLLRIRVLKHVARRETMSCISVKRDFLLHFLKLNRNLFNILRELTKQLWVRQRNNSSSPLPMLLPQHVSVIRPSSCVALLRWRTHNCFVNYTHATGSITTVTTISDSHGTHNLWLHVQLFRECYFLPTCTLISYKEDAFAKSGDFFVRTQYFKTVKYLNLPIEFLWEQGQISRYRDWAIVQTWGIQNTARGPTPAREHHQSGLP
jgi:hypothetical protein